MADLDRELGGGEPARVAPADVGAGRDVAFDGRQVVAQNRVEHLLGPILGFLRLERGRGDQRQQEHRRPQSGDGAHGAAPAEKGRAE